MSPTLPTYTAPVRLSAETIERAYMDAGDPTKPTQILTQPWQVLDARDETTWHTITGLVECEDPDCVISDIPGVVCVVLASDAWAAGSAHLESDELLTVRIPAGEVSA